MSPTASGAVAVATAPDAADPRDRLVRLRALLDDDGLELLTPTDDSEMLAATGRVDGLPVVAFACDPRVQGCAMGAAGGRVVVAAYERAPADGVPVVGAWARRVRHGLLL